ncbi:MAG: fibrobacter succinogenes major paralogous domain-containing protein [Paludibacter sp.]|nr:fibrobacter succinogenes major paralogous domain-containing protein [Paludibacter sp.]
MKKISKLYVLTYIFLTLVFAIFTGCTKIVDLPDGSSIETVKDKDGNVYHTVKIGTQVWMVENLKTTHYRDGSSIANVTDNTAWASLSTGAWCDYSNSAANGTKYGHLYNGYAVIDVRNIAPVGWHVPTDAEWTTLTTYLGGEAVAGGKLKETGTLNWISPNTGATNEAGFSALPGGGRSSDGPFDYFGGLGGYWWSSTQVGKNCAWYRGMGYIESRIYRANYGFGFGNGFSVRCVRDSK